MKINDVDYAFELIKELKENERLIKFLDTNYDSGVFVTSVNNAEKIEITKGMITALTKLASNEYSKIVANIEYL